jgi:hypothetical protein
MPEKLSKTPQLSKDVSSAKFIFANGNIYDGEFTLNDSGSIVRKGFGTFTCQYGVKRLKVI